MIKGIIFDFGHTLIRFPQDRLAVNRVGAETMASWYFRKKHIKIDEAALVETFLAEYAAGQKHAAQTLIESTLEENLITALDKTHAPEKTRGLVKAAVKLFLENEEPIWEAYPDAVGTIRQLYQQDYKLGLYSNAPDDGLVQRLVNSKGFRPWLSPTFSSAGCGWRKPRPDGFLLIAERWNLDPADIVVVGDTLDIDILGAQRAGMHSILVTMDAYHTNDANRHIEPTATAATLSVLPELIARL